MAALKDPIGANLDRYHIVKVWTDPDFDPKQKAFYCGRVLELPTSRRTAYDAKFCGLKDVDPAIPMVAHERAYTSPIWYTS